MSNEAKPKFCECGGRMAYAVTGSYVCTYCRNCTPVLAVTLPIEPAAVLPCQHEELGVSDNDGFRPCLACGVVRRWPKAAVLPEPCPGVKPTTFRWHDNEPHRWVNYSRETPPFRMCSICGGTEEMEPMPEPVDVEALARETQNAVWENERKWQSGRYVDLPTNADIILAALRRVQPPQEDK